MLLNLNTTSLPQSLPGTIPLYVGMPVILRLRNFHMSIGFDVRNFIITPVKWTFTTLLKQPQGETVKVRICRLQLPIQPAFATYLKEASALTLLHLVHAQELDYV